MKPMRSHPVNILENTSRFLILLLIPLLRVLLTSGSGFYAWLSGAWLDLLILSVILGFGIYEWRVFTFTIHETGIRINRGILLKKERFIPYSRMTAVSVESPWYFLPLKAVRLKADTDAGSPKKADFVITVSHALSDEILQRSKQPFSSDNDAEALYTPRNISIIIFSFLASNSVTGIIYLYAALTQTGNILGRDISNTLMDSFTRLATVISFGLPPFFAIIAYIVAICWAASFLLNLMRHMRFSTCRRGGIINIQSGIFTVRKFAITVKRINYIILRQSLLSYVLGLLSVYVHCTGYGKERTELSVLFPAGTGKSMKKKIRELLPEIPFAERQIKPRLRNLSRFLFPPAGLVLSIFGAGLLAIYFFPNFQSFIIFALIMLEIPSMWWLFVKIFSFFFTGLGINDDVLTIYYTRGYSIVTSSIPLKKITKIEISQSLFQLSSNCCDVLIYTYADRIKKQRVKNLYLPQVQELLDPERLPDIIAEQDEM